MAEPRLAKESEDPDLAEARRELSEVFEEAREDGLPRPARVAVEAARRLLPAMFRLSPRPYTVYPTSDREVAIHGQYAHQGSVIVLCEADGGALCLASFPREGRHARYADASVLPDDFLTEALHGLDRLALGESVGP